MSPVDNIPVHDRFLEGQYEASVYTQQPLQTQVKRVVEQYFEALEGQLPTNLYDTVLQEVEKPLLEVVLKQTKGNQSKTAKILGLSRITLRKKMARYGLM